MAKIPVVGIGGSLCACHVVLRAKESAGIVDIGAWGARGGGREGTPPSPVSPSMQTAGSMCSSCTALR